jgi:hypothetical protein
MYVSVCAILKGVMTSGIMTLMGATLRKKHWLKAIRHHWSDCQFVYFSADCHSSKCRSTKCDGVTVVEVLSLKQMPL